MASITYWNRVEPVPRSNSLTRVMAAQVRDPLWLLTRQWQLGEFRGNDAGSAAYVQYSVNTSPLLSWQAGGGPAQTLGSTRAAPLEALVESEPFTPDLATAVELGQQFEIFLAEAADEVSMPDSELTTLRSKFLDAYRIPEITDLAADAKCDLALTRFLRVCGGRAIHGVNMYLAYLLTRPGLPASPAVTTAEAGVATKALDRLLELTTQVYGQLGDSDSPAWTPERLEYNADVSAVSPDGGVVQLTGHAGRYGEFDWYAFDQKGSVSEDRAGRFHTATQSLMPIHARFRGMPNARWWQFESGTLNFSDIRVDLSESAKIIVVDFMLVHGNDWFVIPLTQAVGTLCRVNTVLVHDVFGEATAISRVDGSKEGWSMFTTATEGKATLATNAFLLPPSASSGSLHGDAIEEVRFLRDEMANSAWAIEHTVENGVGQPWSARERAQTQDAKRLPPVNDTDSPLKYLELR